MPPELGDLTLAVGVAAGRANRPGRTCGGSSGAGRPPRPNLSRVTGGIGASP